MSPSIEVRVLGPFAVRDETGRTAGPWQRPSARRLVQLLAVVPRHRLGREEVAEALFPTLSPARSANAVAKAISMTRSAVARVAPEPGVFIGADRTAVWLASSGSVTIDLDGHRQRLQAALSLASGPERDELLARELVEAGALLEGEPYEDWAIRAREELAALRLDARIALARDRYAGHGRSSPDDIIAAWSDVAARDPANEEAAVALVRTYAARGQRDRAIRAYLRSVAALRDELGVEPSPELEAARSELDRAGLRSTAAGGVEPQRGRWALVGRGPVVRRVERQLGRASGSTGPALLLLGPAGVGKTHLAGAVAAGRLREGWLVLSGRSVPGDERIPYAALRAALGPLRDMPGTKSGWLGRIILAGPDDDPLEIHGTADAGLAALAAEIGDLFDDASVERPLLCVLDDLHWADRSFITLIRRLAARPARRRWALLLAARSDEPHHPPPSLGTSVDLIEVAPLSDRATRAAVQQALLADGLRIRPSELAQAVEASRGNPFFAIELGRSVASARHSEHRRSVPAVPSSPSTPDRLVPEAIVSLLRDRVGALGPGARTLLPIVAVAGSEAAYEAVLGAAARLGMEPRLAQRGLEELLETRQVVESGDRLTLSHPLLRDAALSATNALRRGAIHGAVADELEAAPAPNATSLDDALASHRLGAFEATHLRSTAAAAADAGFRAGRRARRLLATEAAERLLRGALAAFATLDETHRARLRTDAVRASIAVGDISLDRDDDRAAEFAYQEARALAGSDDERALAWSSLAGIRYRHGDLAGSATILEAGLAALSGMDPLAAARLESDLAWDLYRMGDVAGALTTLESALPIIEAGGDPVIRCRTLDRMGMVLASGGRPSDALAAFERGLREAANAMPAQELVIRVHRAPLLEEAGHPDEAEADVETAAGLAEAAGDSYMRSIIHSTWANMLDDRANLGAALAERDAEVALLVRLANPRHLANAQLHRASLLDRLGRTRAAREALIASRAAADRVEDEGFRASFRQRLDAVATRSR